MTIRSYRSPIHIRARSRSIARANVLDPEPAELDPEPTNRSRCWPNQMQNLEPLPLADPEPDPPT